MLTLTLEGNNDKTYEDVDHEEGNNDDIDEKEHCHRLPVVVDRTDVLSVRVNGLVHQAGGRGSTNIQLYIILIG